MKTSDTITETFLRWPGLKCGSLGSSRALSRSAINDVRSSSSIDCTSRLYLIIARVLALKPNMEADVNADSNMSRAEVESKSHWQLLLMLLQVLPTLHRQFGSTHSVIEFTR
jgi:hypothetical protein